MADEPVTSDQAKSEPMGKTLGELSQESASSQENDKSEIETKETEAENSAVETKTSEPEKEKAADAPEKHHWWQLKKKKSAPETTLEANKLPEQPTDSLEANLKALAQHMEVKEQNDYWHLRFRKKTVLILGGVIIVMLWAGWFWRQTNEGSKWSIRGIFLVSEKQAPPPSPIPLPEKVIRIRYRTEGQASAAALLAQKLANQGFPVVDTILDDQSDYTGILVVSKASQINLRDQLEGILAQDYQLSSPGAELTADSDFDAIVLFAPNATPSASVK